jgi:hypothetical protein
MFGGLAFLTYGNMTVGVHRDDLVARINPDATEAALERPGVRPFDITGRPMRGWVLVACEHLGVCARPVSLRRTDLETGRTELVDLPCGATRDDTCPPAPSGRGGYANSSRNVMC